MGGRENDESFEDGNFLAKDEDDEGICDQRVRKS